MADSLNQIDEPEPSKASTLAADGALGVFTTVSLVLLLWGLCWLKSYRPLQHHQIINVYFSEVAGLNDNAAVYVDGVRVGMVDKMDWQSEHHVLVRLRIMDSEIVIPVGSKYEILTNGIVGAKYVQIDMPSIKPGDPKPPPVDDKAQIAGEDPVRPELAVNKLAITLSEIDLERVGRNFKEDRERLCRAADQLAILANKTMPVIDRAPVLEDNLNSLTKDMSKTSKKIANMMDDPHFTSDLKETARQAHETANSIQAAIHDLNRTLADKPLRKDVLQTFHQLNESTANIEKSLEAVQQVTSDKGLRSDLKDIVHEAHATMDRVNEITSKPMGADVRNTLTKTNDAIDHLDIASKQLNQILSKRGLFFQFLVGRPGYIKPAKVKKQNTIQQSKAPGADPNAGATGPATTPSLTPATDAVPPNGQPANGP